MRSAAAVSSLMLGLMKSETPVREEYGNRLLTIASERSCLSKPASYIYLSVQEPGIDGLARTNLRFS